MSSDKTTRRELAVVLHTESEQPHSLRTLLDGFRWDASLEEPLGSDRLDDAPRAETDGGLKPRKSASG